MKIQEIIKKSLQDAGIYCSEGDSVPADYALPAFSMLKNVIDEMNLITSITFSQQSDIVDVSSKKLLIKPLTEDEQAIIDGGGTIDLTNRLIDFIPYQSPVVYVNGFQLTRLSYSELLSIQCGVPEYFTYNLGENYSEIIFNACPNQITLLRSVPISMDEEPFGEIHVPSAYVNLLCNKLSEAISIRYQYTESASMFAQKADRSANILANNNAKYKPISINLHKGLNKFKSF